MIAAYNNKKNDGHRGVVLDFEGSVLGFTLTHSISRPSSYLCLSSACQAYAYFICSSSDQLSNESSWINRGGAGKLMKRMMCESEGLGLGITSYTCPLLSRNEWVMRWDLFISAQLFYSAAEKNKITMSQD